ncbi:hypothetical protein ACFVXA_24395 [Streptomyces sp. NPDC058246]|uniref:Rv1733c family protein n=1 Tax=Streptomyces sp. NPDC058246 TaxID=3346400 RepID=UPI0036E36526
MRTGVKMWRWRRNPLRRSTDRVEAWAVLISGLVLVVGAPVVGVATGMTVTASGPRPPADWHRVSAVLTQKAPAPSTPSEVNNSNYEQVKAAVQWHAADGSSHRGFTWVRPNSAAGSRTTIWLDDAGMLREDPVQEVQTQSRALALGTAAATGTAALAVGAYALVRVRLSKRNASQVEREWGVIGPEWRRHSL